MVSVASVLAVSTLRPRDYTKYTARVYGPDPISVRGSAERGTPYTMCVPSQFLIFTMASGGYDHEFVDNVPHRYICPICAKPFREPHLAVCCGKHFCESCLVEWSEKRGKKT